MNLENRLANMVDSDYQKLRETIIEKKKELEGHTKKEKEIIIIKWINEIHEKFINSITNQSKGNYEKIPPLSKYDAEKLIKMRGYKCQYPKCNEDIDLKVHHIIPRSTPSSSNDPSNLIVLCAKHHNQADRGYIPATRLKMIVSDSMKRKKRY